MNQSIRRSWHKEYERRARVSFRKNLAECILIAVGLIAFGYLANALAFILK